MSTNEPIPAADFDRLASAWLADGPAELADRVLDDALREVHLTHQRRRMAAPWSGPFGPRRFYPMNILAKTGLGLAAVLAVAIGGITLLGGHSSAGAPSPSPIATPIPTPIPTPRQIGSPMPGPALGPSFASSVYDYSVRYPASWHTTAATHPWSGTINSGADAPWWGDPSLDVLQGTDVRLVVWGQAIPEAAGMTQEQAAALWARNLGIGGGVCQADSQLPATFVLGGGASYNVAYTVGNGCPSNGGLLKDGVVYEVAVVSLGHNWLYGWDFTFDGRLDAPYVRAMLDSLTLVGPRSF